MRRALERLRSFGALTPSERRLFLRAWAWLLLVDLGLRLLPFLALQRLLFGRPLRPVPAGLDQAAFVARSERLVDLAARHHLVPMTCLRRALALKKLLYGCGLEAELKIGVRRDGVELVAHAWLVYEGKPVGDVMDMAVTYAPLGGVR